MENLIWGKILGITGEQEKQAYQISPGARKALYGTGLALAGAGGAAGGAAVKGRKQFTAAKVDTGRGSFGVVGEKRFIKDLAQATKKKDPKAVWEASRRLLVVSKPKQGERQPPELSGAQLAEGAEEIIEEKQEGDISKAQAMALLKGVKEKAEKMAALTPKQLKGLAAGLGAAGAATGAGATYAGMRGRDFAVVDTPLGVVAGRKKDLKGMQAAAQKGKQEAFQKHLKRTVPAHPVVTRLLRAKQGEYSPELIKMALSLRGALSGIKGIGQRLIGRGPKSVAGSLYGKGGKTLGGLSKGVDEVSFAALKPTKATTKALAGTTPASTAAVARKRLDLPEMASQAGAPAPGATRKPLVSTGTKLLLGGAGVLGAGTMLGGKIIGEGARTIRAGMAVPQPGYMQARRYA